MSTSEGQQRDEEGQFVPQMDLNKVIEAMDSREPYTLGELTDMLNVPRSTMHRYLNELADQGRIRKKKPSSRAVIWMRPVEETRGNDE